MDEKLLARIRLVTRRYNELKGLWPACLGCMFCLLSAAARTGYFLECLMVLVPAAVLASYWFDRVYYPARFGRVRYTAETNIWAWVMCGGAALLNIVDRRSLGKGLPGLIPLLLAVHAAWVVFRDWPLRIHHLVIVVAGIVSSLLYARTVHETEVDWFIASGMLFGIAFIVTGFADHRLLALTLDSPLELSENSDEQTV